jgi:hypothetical protein
MEIGVRATSAARSKRSAAARVVEKTQCDPACKEVGVDLIGGVVWSNRVVTKFERQARLVEIEQFARDLPPFAPPTVRVDQGLAIPRRQYEQHRRLISAVRAPGILTDLLHRESAGH